MRHLRRHFIKTFGYTGMGVIIAPIVCSVSVDKREWPSEMTTYKDEITGARVRMLTQGPSNDYVIYQTHPMWTQGMKHLVFHSDRPGYQAPHALEMATGKIFTLTDSSPSSIVLSRKDDRLFYLLGREIFVTTVNTSSKTPAPAMKVAVLPDEVNGVLGGISLDADETTLYTGIEREPDKKWALIGLELDTGKWRTVVDLDFQIGHLQANPVRSGLIMFCHETGGDAPQRTWVVRSDGSGLRPLYKETYNEWVTHEVWWGEDRVIFTIWPYDEERAQKPHGVLSVDLETGTPTLHSQYRAWHTHGAPGGAWAMGDDFERNIWLIKVKSGERRLLTQGHLGKGCKTHPHASFTPDAKAIVFNSSRNGHENIFMVEIPDWDTLK